MMKRPRRSSRFLRTILMLVVVIALGAILFANGKQWFVRQKQQKGIHALGEDLRQLEGERQATEDLLNALRSPTFIEREARERLGYKKPGETAVIFPAEEEGSGGAKKDAAHARPSLAEWIEYFFEREKQVRD